MKNHKNIYIRGVQEVLLFFNPLYKGGGEGALFPPPSLYFCLLLKIIIWHQYLKILDLANLFVADAPMKKKNKKYSFTPLSEHFEIWV